MYNLSNICKVANQLTKEGYTKSDAFKQAWQLAKQLISKVAGTSFGKRNKAIAHLTRYDMGDIHVYLERENNPYDKNAIQVITEVSGKGRYCVGYIPAIIAKILAPVMDSGTQVKAIVRDIVGGWDIGINYGLRLDIAI